MISSSSYFSSSIDNQIPNTNGGANLIKSLTSVHLPPPPRTSTIYSTPVLDPAALKRSATSLGFVSKKQPADQLLSTFNTSKQQSTHVRSVSLNMATSSGSGFVNALSTPPLSSISRDNHSHTRFTKPINQSAGNALETVPLLSVPTKATRSTSLNFQLSEFQTHTTPCFNFAAGAKPVTGRSVGASVSASTSHNPSYDPKLTALNNIMKLSYLPNGNNITNNPVTTSTATEGSRTFQIKNTIPNHFMSHFGAPLPNLVLSNANSHVTVNSGSEIPEPKDMPSIVDDGTKPPYSYATLIGMAILRSEERKLTLSQIYKWINETFVWYQTKSGWQNSIRHNLSLNKAFRKQERPKGDPGKGNYWIVEPGCEFQFVRGRTTKRQQQPSTYLSMSQDTENQQKKQQRQLPTETLTETTSEKVLSKSAEDETTHHLSSLPTITHFATLQDQSSALSKLSSPFNTTVFSASNSKPTETSGHDKENEAHKTFSAVQLETLGTNGLSPKSVQIIDPNTSHLSSFTRKRSFADADKPLSIESSSSFKDCHSNNSNRKKQRKKSPPASIQVQSIPVLGKNFLYDSSLSQNSPNKLWFTNIDDNIDTAQVIYNHSVVIKSPIRNNFDTELLLGKGLVVNGSTTRGAVKDHALSIMTHMPSSSETGTDELTPGYYKSLGPIFSPVAFEFEDIYPYSPLKMSPQRMRFGIYQDEDMVLRTENKSSSESNDRCGNIHDYNETVEELDAEPENQDK